MIFKNSKERTFAMVGTEGKNTQLIRDEAEKRDIKFITINPRSITSTLKKGKIKYTAEATDLESISAFLFRGISSTKTSGKLKVSVFPEMLLFAKYLYHDLGKAVIDEKLALENYSLSKFATGFKLSKAGIPYTNTYLYMKVEQVKRDSSKLDYPLILKPTVASKGKGIELIKTEKALLDYLSDMEGEAFYPNLLQQHIPNDGDYRVVVVGDEAIVTVKKERKKGSVVSNMSKGNKAELVTGDKELEKLAVKAAKALRIDIAGVDIIEHKKTGKRYILEVNRAPQIYRTTEFSGVNIAEKIVDIMESKVR